MSEEESVESLRAQIAALQIENARISARKGIAAEVRGLPPLGVHSVNTTQVPAPGSHSPIGEPLFIIDGKLGILSDHTLDKLNDNGSVLWSNHNYRSGLVPWSREVDIQASVKLAIEDCLPREHPTISGSQLRCI